MTCPEGHQLPHAGEKGQCTPLRCAWSGQRAPFEAVADAPRRKKALAVKEATSPEEAAEVHMQLRHRKVNLPPDLTADQSEEWAENRLNELRAVAVADMEWDLRYGDETQRREARRDLLAATGMRNREQLGSVAPSIVINFGADRDAPEWLRRAAEKEIQTLPAKSGGKT